MVIPQIWAGKSPRPTAPPDPDPDAHYCAASYETIDAMRAIYGTACTLLWIEMTIFKYQQRIGLKGNDGGADDLRKINRYRELAARIASEPEVAGIVHEE